jgi:hypothetical protein
VRSQAIEKFLRSPGCLFDALIQKIEITILTPPQTRLV